MSILLLLLFVGALYSMEYFRRQGESFAARLTTQFTTAGAKLAKFPLQAHPERPAGLERRQAERRRIERRHAA